MTVGIGSVERAARPRDRQPHRGRAAAARRLDRRERVGDQHRLRHRAGRAARQRERPARRSAARHAVGRRRAGARRLHGVAASPACRRSTPSQIPEATGEVATENNSRSVLVPPQAGKRRLLVVEGAPGFEHTFLKRALADDPGLEVDAVVRKGQNDDGRDTFYVQADSVANGGAVERVSVQAFGAVRLRRRDLRQHRSRLLHARTARADERLRRRARRRPARARRAIVRSPGPRRHARSSRRCRSI